MHQLFYVFIYLLLLPKFRTNVNMRYLRSCHNQYENWCHIFKMFSDMYSYKLVLYMLRAVFETLY